MNQYLDLFKVDACTRCSELVACRSQIVNGRGRVGARIMVVGQNPGEFEDKEGEPFVGRSGKLLGLLLDMAGIRRSEVYKTNAVRCWSPGNRKPKKAELDNCRGYLIDEIKALMPDVIIALGDTALQSLYGSPDPRIHEADLDQWADDFQGMMAVYNLEIDQWEADGKPKGLKPKKPKAPPKPRAAKGKVVQLGGIAGATLTQPDTGIPMIATYHPSYLMRGNWEEVGMVAEHFAKALRVANGEQKQGTLGDYFTIENLTQLEALRDYMLDPRTKVIWYDCETYGGTDWKHSELLCISLATKPGEGFVVPILHNNNGVVDLWPGWVGHLNEMIDLLKEIFGSDKPKGGQNQLYDLRTLERDAADPWVESLTAFGIKVNGPLIDTELEHALVAEALPHNMTSNLILYTDMPFYEDDVKANKKAMHKLEDKVLHKYSAADADGLPRLHKVLMPWVRAEGADWIFDNVSMPMLRLCRHLEDRGFPVDRKWFDKLCQFYDLEIAKAEQALWAAVPQMPAGWKYNDPTALRNVLFGILALAPSGRKTDAGKGCQDCNDGVCFDHDQTGRDALKEVQAKTPHPVIPILLNLKKITKRRSTYLAGVDGKSAFLAKICKDGRIHSAYKVSRAETGRLASENPNAQNIPNYVHIHPHGFLCLEKKDECKEHFDDTFGLNTENAFHDMVAAGPGMVIMNADWSQLEVWVLAYRLLEDAGDDTLLKILMSGDDIHTVMARKMYPNLEPDLPDREWKEKFKDLRRKAKGLVFGTGYGLTPFGAFQRGIGDTEEDAEDLIKRYKASVPGLDRYFRIVRQQLETRGYVENVFGRRRHIDVLALLKGMGARADLEALVREAINFPIQSGGSDLHSIVSVATDNSPALAARGCEAIISVHDSLTFEAAAPDNQYVIQTAWIIKDLWQNIAWNLMKRDGTPLHWKTPVEIEWGKRWGSPEWKLDALGNVQNLDPTIAKSKAEAKERETYETKLMGRPTLPKR